MAGRRRVIGAVVAMLILSTPSAVSASAATAARTVKLRRVATLARTTAMAVRTGDTALYVTEQSGRVRAIAGGRLAAGPVLDLTADTFAAGEQGLLGIAFAPDGSHLYVDYTDKSGDTHVDEFEMNGAVADPSSRRNLLIVDQPQANHNGGQLAFGPDGYLYIALGDGGSADDEGSGHAPGGNAQSLATLLGKILRIDPTATASSPYTVPSDNPFVGRNGAKAEIWAYGLRNPWRFSFDADTGDLWIGDVGQNEWEEVDFAPATKGRDAGRGDNFGWNRREGTHEHRGSAPPAAVAPVYEQAHDNGACSVTGGFVYRGTRIGALAGRYVFTDYCAGELMTLTPSGNGKFRAQDLGVNISAVSSFGQAANRDLYVLSQSRGIFKLVPR
jgi:glucose/arabinose dehydrogenase